MREAHAGEVAALTARASVAELFAAELRARLDDVQGKLTDAQAELAAAMDRADQLGCGTGSRTDRAGRSPG